MPLIAVDQDHQIVSEPRVFDVGVLAIPRDLPRSFKHPIHLVEVEVTEQGRIDPALWNAFLARGFQHGLQEMQDVPVFNPLRHRPDRSGRLEILKVHVAKVPVADGVDLDQIAGLTTGFTGADLANLVNEAAIVATRRKGDAVTLDDFTAAIERIVAGLEKKSRVLGPAERSRVAHHEMGHALVAATLPGVDPVHKVSIIPRGVGALGYTMQRPTEDRFLLGRQELENRIAVLMGGRAAEALIFDGEVSTGASDDLQRATQIAMEMVTRYGMNETVGQRTYAPPPQPFLAEAAANHVDASETTEREIDVAVRDLVAKAFGRATDILRSRRADLDEGARLLLAQETLTADQFPAVRSTVQPAKPAA